MKEARENFGKKLSKIRNEKNLTQDQLAEQTGVDRVTISRIENGKFSPGLDVLNRIAIAMNCELEIKEKEDQVTSTDLTILKLNIKD